MDLLARMPQSTTHPVDVGQRSEAAILAALVHCGFHVLLPFGVNQRYDLVIDLDGNSSVLSARQVGCGMGRSASTRRARA